MWKKWPWSFCSIFQYKLKACIILTGGSHTQWDPLVRTRIVCFRERRRGPLAKPTCGSTALPAPPHHTPAEFIITAQTGWGRKYFYHQTVTHMQGNVTATQTGTHVETHANTHALGDERRGKQWTEHHLLPLYTRIDKKQLVEKAASLVGSRSKCCWLIISWWLIAFLKPNKAECGTAFNTWWIRG